MAEFKFKETGIPTQYGESLKDFGLSFEPSNVPYMFDILITSMSDFLGLTKNKTNKTSLAIKDLKGNLLLAGIVAYHPNEDEEMPGNWSYEMTFNEDDIKDTNIYLASDPQFKTVYGRVAYDLHGIEIPNAMHLQPLMNSTASTLKDWLDANAKEGEEVSVTLAGYFVASVEIEKGEKVFSIVPDGAMKRLIKDDSALEATEAAS